MTYFENKNESLGDRMRRKAFAANGLPAPTVAPNGNERISGNESPDEAVAALTGDLSEKPIPWLLMLAQQFEVTGRMQVGLSACPVVIQFGLGRPVHAQSPFCSGTEAIMDLFIWKDGKVKFEPGKHTDAVTVYESTEELIARGEDYAFNAEYLQQNGITELSFLVRPAARPALGEVEKRLKDGQPIDLDLQMEFFSNTYGTRNIKDTAEKLSLRPSQWVSIAANLLQLGILLAPDGRSIATEDANGNETVKLAASDFDSLRLQQPGGPTSSAPSEPLNKIWQSKTSNGEVTQGVDTSMLNQAPQAKKLSRLGEITQGINIGRIGEVTQATDISKLNGPLENTNATDAFSSPSTSNPNLQKPGSPATSENPSDSQPKMKLSRLGEITQGMNVAALHERIRSQSLAKTDESHGNSPGNASALSPNNSQTGMNPATTGSPFASQTGLNSASLPSPFNSITGLPAAQPNTEPTQSITPSSPSSSQTGMPSSSLISSLADVSAAMLSSKAPPPPIPSQSGEITANMAIPPSVALPRKPQPTSPRAMQEMTIQPGGEGTSGLPGHIVILEPTDHNRILSLLTSPETGIFTFDALQFLLAREFDRACRFKSLLTLALFSIRRSEDEVVSREVSTLVTATVSRIKRDVDVFGHFGSRAYALVLPSVDSNQACLLVDRISKDLIAITPDLKEFNINLHFGLATVPHDAAELNGLVKSAQVAMFHAASNRILRTQAVQLRK